MKALQINRIMTFGTSRKMKVVRESIVNNKVSDTYSLVSLVGSKGKEVTAKRRFDGSLRILF